MEEDFDLCSNSSCSAYKNDLNEKIKSLESMLANINTHKPKPTVYVKCWNKFNRFSENQNCCGQNCKETTGHCREGNGAVWICYDGSLIKYSHSTKNMESDNLIMVLAEKEFMRADIPNEVPEDAYVCRFFEVIALPDPVKETDFNWFEWELEIGLYKNDQCYFRLGNSGNYRTADGTCKRFFNDRMVGNDVFGCGHIIPPKNKPNEPTQIFFTLNKKQIGKTILLNDVEDLLPHILLKRCDARINFGTDDAWPFVYDIKNHVAGD
ncbi:unnamed protein product [Meloidogyne enterolobii]|uniref:Uncharacterized protein n=1 Tax=Meloidogyne enterolobii TaxID=390850 RepID=A0ACB0ZAM9_MELEN